MKKLFFSLALILFCKIGFSQNVIDPVLQDVLNQKGDEMIDINIIFKSQIDLNKLRTRTLLSNDKKTRRNILVDELKHFSEEKQQEVLSLLQAEKSSDRVSNIRTYWLSNAMKQSVSAAAFACVGSLGLANYTYASHSVGVRPIFWLSK